MILIITSNMKVVFIGLCGHSMNAYNTLTKRNDITLCGVAPGSDHENITESFDEKIQFFTSWKNMLDETKPDLAIVSPVFGITGRIVTECAKLGIDVFCEKPVAKTFDELERVENAVKTNGIRFCAMHYLRYAPAFYHGAQLVKNGVVGKITMLNAQKSYKYGIRPKWYGDRELYVGTIPWVGIHAIDWIYHFSGKRFLSVTSKCFGNTPEMAALCQFQMEDGVIASINLDYYRPSNAPTHDDDRIRVVGTEGVLEIFNNQIKLINKDGTQTIIPDTAPDLLDEFIDGKNAISSDEIFYMTRVAIAARDSADKNETINI